MQTARFKFFLHLDISLTMIIFLDSSFHRIATALAIPSQHSLEMNSLLSILLERHCKMPKMLSESTQTTDTPSENTRSPSPPPYTPSKTENEENEFLLNYKLKMYEV
jgi:hypothetical protein